MTQTAIETNKFVVVDVNRKGAIIGANGENKLVEWSELKAASEQPDRELATMYSDLLREAERIVLNSRPVRVEAREINTNVYGVVGEGIDGNLRLIRRYALRLRADEGQDQYSMAGAEAEAAEIRKRNRIA